MRYYIVSWDMNGVEFFEEITEHHPDNWAKGHLFDSIKQSKRVEKPMSFSIQSLKLRAQVNSHRHYEIYVFSGEEDITKEDIRAWFTEHPQSFADWVRKNHSYKVYDNRATDKAVIV
jgi:hypothetical protein